MIVEQEDNSSKLRQMWGTVVSKEFIEKLIELGKIPNLENPEVSPHFQVLKPYEKYMVGTWNEWFPVCKHLSIEDHIAVLRALVFAEHYAHIGGQDSGCSAIWVYKKLDEKLPYRESLQIALWVVKNTKNIYLPFGNIPHRMFFEENLGKFDCDYDGTLLEKICHERSVYRQQKEQMRKN